MDQAGIDIIAHMRTLTMTRIESLQHSLFHLEDSLPILVAEFERMIAEHRAALQYEEDVLRRQDAHMMGALYAAPGQVGAQVLSPSAVEIARQAMAQLPLQPSFQTRETTMVAPGVQMAPGMTTGPALAAQAAVAAQSPKGPLGRQFAAEVLQAAPLPQSVVKAVMYEPGDTRPPEATPGHMDPNGPSPRTAEELLAARDAERAARITEG